MPSFVLHTNVSGGKITVAFLKEISTIVANSLGKPEGYVAVHVIPDQKMIFGGTAAPCGLATLMSIGKLGQTENKKHSAAIHAHLEKALGIPKDRIYITYADAKPSQVGYNGTTFQEILGGD